MRRHLATIALVFLLAAPAWAATEKRVALVIGNDRYAALGNLKNAGNDAVLMLDRLKALGYSTSQVRNADRAQMLKALQAFRTSAAAADLAVVYYAGHGLQSRGENYLLPTEIDVQEEVDLPDAAVSLRTVVDQLQTAGARRSLIILDACRDNPLVKRFLDTARVSGRSSGVGRGLTVVERTPPETVVWFSVEAGQIAADGTGRNSPFTTALAAALEKPGLSTDEVFRQVVREVKGQTPRPYGMFSDSVALHPGAAERPVVRQDPAPAPPQTGGGGADREALFWASIKDGRDAAEFEEFLRQFPNGTFAGLARSRLDKLKGTQVALAAPRPEPALDALDREMVIGRKASLREAPDAKAKLLATLGEGESVQVTGKVTGGNWYRIERKGHPAGYVVADTLEEPPAYKARKDKERLAAEAAAEAERRRLAALASPPAPPKPSEDGRAWNQRGMDAYNSGNHPLSVEHFRKAAELGNTAGMYNLGKAYEDGEGAAKDYGEAMRWYRNAADLGNSGAVYQIGWLYQHGIGVATDFAEAMRWYRKAVDLGHKLAPNQIGWFYHSGLGVATDYAEAMRWYRKAADLGSDMAMNNIGNMYFNGKGVAVDRAAAKGWYEQAAAKGNKYAKETLAKSY